VIMGEREIARGIVEQVISGSAEPRLPDDGPTPPPPEKPAA